MKGSQKGSQVKPVPKATTWKDRISEKDHEELKAIFDLYDEDHGGTIDPVEIEKILEELGLKGRNRVVFDMINGIRALNRPINFNEFVEIICSNVGDLKSREGAAKVFTHWDLEGTGVADFNSFHRVARELGQTLNDEDLTDMMHNAYILNGTQTHDNFNFDEFYNIVTKKRA